MLERTCKECGETKPLDAFPDHQGGGKRWKCRICRTKKTADWYQRNREHRLAKARAQYAANPAAVWTPEKRKRANELARQRAKELTAEVYEAYGNECVACGENELLFLSLDHVNNDGAEMRRSTPHHTGPALCRWAKKNGYPDTIQILCMNCNFGKWRNGGVLVRDRRISEGSTAIPEGSRAKRPEARSPIKCESIDG